MAELQQRRFVGAADDAGRQGGQRAFRELGASRTVDFRQLAEDFA